MIDRVREDQHHGDGGPIMTQQEFEGISANLLRAIELQAETLGRDDDGSIFVDMETDGLVVFRLVVIEWRLMLEVWSEGEAEGLVCQLQTTDVVRGFWDSLRRIVSNYRTEQERIGAENVASVFREVGSVGL